MGRCKTVEGKKKRKKGGVGLKRREKGMFGMSFECQPG